MALVAGTVGGTIAERLLHAVQQQLFVVRLLDKIMGTGLERAHHDRHIRMPADEDDGQVQLAHTHFFLHVQPAHTGHANVQQHTSIEACIAGIEERDATGKRQGLEPDRLQ
ncbi:hypothetical protein D9M72_595700 [compost metagenome]